MADLVPMSQAATTSLVSTLQNTDLIALARVDGDSETGYRSKVSRIDTVAKKTAKETDYSDLATTSKNLIGAINEVNTKASKYDDLTNTATGTIATFSDGGDNIPVKGYECDINAIESGSGAKSPSNPYTISGWDSVDIRVEDNEHTGNTTTITLPQTVYGGKLIFDNGWKVRVTHGIVDLGTLTGWYYNTTQQFWQHAVDGIESDTREVICTEYNFTTKNWGSMVNYEFGISGTNIRLHNDTVSTSTDLETQLSGVMLVYPLATPTDIPISSLDRVKTISGVNNIFANSGDNSVVYFTSNADELASLVRAFTT